MAGERSYGVLSKGPHDTVEFAVAGRIERTWQVSPPLDSIAVLIQRCLTNLAHEGWRPISHQPNPGEAVVLARVPYPAGTKLAVYGTLRFTDHATLLLTVAGATMQEWEVAESPEDTLRSALRGLEDQGWRVHRRYASGATVVRG